MTSQDCTPRYLLFVDSSPLPENGSGIQVLSWNWIEAMKDQTVLIFSRNPQVDTLEREARSEAPVPLYFLPRLPFIRPESKMRSPLEVMLFPFVIPKLLRLIRASGATRIFALSGARFWFLPQVRILRWAARLPLELYLVDDFEGWQRLHGRNRGAGLATLLERGTVSHVERLWAISEYYARHLEEKYGTPARCLPITARGSDLRYRPYRRTNPDVRSFVYVGAVNLLYEDALIAFCAVLARMNRSLALGYQSRVDIYTYGELTHPELTQADHVRIRYREPDAVLATAQQEAWASVLPYAFGAESRLMVSTSFSLKFTNALMSGRPMIFFGPPYSAVVAHARDNHLPLVANSVEELTHQLARLPQEDGPELISRYEKVFDEFHSAEALRRRLAQPLTSLGRT